MPHRLVLAGCAVAAAALAGCSSSGGGPSSTPAPSTTSSSTSSTTSSGTSAAGSSAPASGAGSSTPQSAALVPLLITASDIGTGFAAKPDDSSDDSGPPCDPNAKDPTDQYPPARQAKVDFANTADTVEVTQQVVAYDDAGTAAKLVKATEAGLDCRTGTIGGKAVVIEPVTGGAPTGPDVAKRWDAEIASENVVATFILYAKNSTVELLGFIAAKSAADTVDVRQAASAAAAKLVHGAK